MNIRSYFSRVLLLAAFVLGVGIVPAQAQEYKENFNAALETAKKGSQALKAKNVGEAEAAFAKAYNAMLAASQAATEAEDSKVANNAKYVAAQIAYKAGFLALQQENYETALDHFTVGVEAYPTFAMNHRGRAMVLQDTEQIDAAMQAYAKAIEVGRANGDYKTANQAENAIRDYYIYQASQRLSAENPSDADAAAALETIAELKQYLELGANAYYYMAVAHDAQGDFEQAIALSDQALELHNGSRTDKAKIYFIKGEALMELGQNPAARQAFENASYGQYQASAKHYLELLGNTQ